MPKTPSPQRIQLMRELMDAKRKTTLIHSQYMAKNREYSPGEHLFMREVHFVMAVGLGEGRTMSELARTLNVTQGAVSQLVARMEKKGFVVRHKCADDKRQTVATLTEKGRLLYQEHTRYDLARYTEILEMLSGYSDEELRRIRDFETILQAIFTKADNVH